MVDCAIDTVRYSHCLAWLIDSLSSLFVLSSRTTWEVSVKAKLLHETYMSRSYDLLRLILYVQQGMRK